MKPKTISSGLAKYVFKRVLLMSILSRSLIRSRNVTRHLIFYAPAIPNHRGNSSLAFIPLPGVRAMATLGHDVNLIPAQPITPFVLGNKKDHHHAFAIAKASQPAHLRFVTVKAEQQQQIYCLHRIC